MRERPSEEVTDDRAVLAPPRPGAYAGLSRRDASRMALRILSAAQRTTCWLHLPEHLALLRDVIQPRDRRAA